MLNTEEFVKRLKNIMKTHQMSSSNFADHINVQRSSISHILSGRNKPSLEFVLKIVDNFSDVDINWLLKGNGSYNIKKETLPLPTDPYLANQKNDSVNKKRVIKIVMFYNDGTFEEFHK